MQDKNEKWQRRIASKAQRGMIGPELGATEGILFLDEIALLIAMEMQYQKYKRTGLIEEDQQGPEDGGSGRRPKLKVVGWPNKPRRPRRKKSS